MSEKCRRGSNAATEKNNVRIKYAKIHEIIMSTNLREIYANVFRVLSCDLVDRFFRVDFVWFRGQIFSCLFSVLSRTNFFVDRFS